MGGEKRHQSLAVHLPERASEELGVDTPADKLPVFRDITALQVLPVSFLPIPWSRMASSVTVTLSIASEVGSPPSGAAKLLLFDIDQHDACQIGVFRECGCIR